jgi:two-component system OmpR family sensor kinase
MRRWLLPAILATMGVAGGLALLGQRDTMVYVEASLPLVVAVTGVLAAVAVFAVQRWSDSRTQREERARAEVESAARAARTRLIARLDHEIKNPVTAIRAGLANVPQSEVSPQAAAAIRSIDEQAQRLSRLVADLRKLGELESVDIEAEDVDLAEVVAEVGAATSDLPGSGERRLEVVVPRIPWQVRPVRGDRDLIFLAAMNLVANSVKFSPPGASIELRALEEDRHAVIEVADSGIGIPDGELGQVWEELARGEDARAVPGSGIGLALVRTIVERHGGDVTINSQPGRGTVVRMRFRLP